MRKLLPAACGAVLAAVTLTPTITHAQEGCPIGQYLAQTGSDQRSDDVRCLQTALNGAGYNSGPVDGWFGPITHAAVLAYQTAAGITVDGEVGGETAGTLGLWNPQPRRQQQSSSGGGGGGGGGDGGGNASSSSSSGGGTVWDSLAQCESGGNWSISTGNGYYGGLQFLQSTWTANGGSGNPANASREEQIRVAENLRAKAGFDPWPACSRKLGLR